MKRHPKAATRPPSTAVNLVDFLRQMPMVKGDISKDIEVDRAPNQPGIDRKKQLINETKSAIKYKFGLR